MKNSRKKAIMFIIMVLIILLIVIVKVLNDKNSKNNNQDQADEEAVVDYYSDYQEQRASEGITANDMKAAIEDDVEKYYTVRTIINNFNTYVNYLNSTANDLDLFVPAGQEQQALSEYRQTGITVINDLLADNYKKTKNVTNESIYNYLKAYSNKTYTIQKMYKVEDSDYINTYFVYGLYESTQFNFVIILDRYRYTYEIYLNDYFVDKGYNLNDSSSMKTLNIESIEQNENNSFQYKVVNKEAVASDYLNEYINMMINTPEKAYELLDSSYKSKRFGDITEFKKYVSDVIENIKDMGIDRVLSQYKITQYDNYSEYVCIDNLGSIFIFKVTGVMEYTVLLDTYTVPVESYDKEYEEANDDKKAQLCLNRFFECLNNKDYEKAYSYLNSTFKESNFESVESFKSFIEKCWFDCNLFNYTEMKNNSNTGEYTIIGEVKDYISDGSYNNLGTYQTFVIKPGASIRNFELSFAMP